MSLVKTMVVAAVLSMLGCGGAAISYPAGTCVKGNCSQGKCLLKWGKVGNTPEYYYGECAANLPNGKGLGNHRGPGTALYVGQYERGLEHGLGVKYYDTGSVYSGEFRDGKKHGHGTQWYSDGSAYKGEFRDHSADGKGICYHADGTAHECRIKGEKETMGKSLGRLAQPPKPKRPPDPLGR